MCQINLLLEGKNIESEKLSMQSKLDSTISKLDALDKRVLKGTFWNTDAVAVPTRFKLNSLNYINPIDTVTTGSLLPSSSSIHIYSDQIPSWMWSLTYGPEVSSHFVYENTVSEWLPMIAKVFPITKYIHAIEFKNEAPIFEEVENEIWNQ